MTALRQRLFHNAAFWLWLGLCVSVLLGGCQTAPILMEATSVSLAYTSAPTPISPPGETPVRQEGQSSGAIEQFVASEPIVTMVATSAPIVEQAIPTATSSPIVENALSTATPSPELSQIAIEPPVYHVVEPGDTVFAIALRYDVTVEDIVTANRLASADRIDVGQKLLIPTDLPATPSVVLPVATRLSQPVQQTPPLLQEAVYSCPENSAVFQLQLPSDPIQIMADGERIFLIADGSLYDLSLADVAQGGQPKLTNLMPPEKIVGNYLIREFVYLTSDSRTGDLLVLDKTNDIYRYSRSGVWTMEVPAQPVPGQFPDPQYIAIQEKQGSILALDSDLSHIWELSRQKPMPKAYYINKQIESAVDMALVQNNEGEALHILTREGTVLRVDRYRSGQSNISMLPFERVNWPSQVQMSTGQLMVVDGNSRSIRFYEPTNFTSDVFVVFRHPNMQRLRHAAVVDQTVYALAGRMLYIVPLAQSNVTCGPVVYDDNFYFDGQNIHDLLPRVRLPFANVVLPIRPRSYPGARRLYRYGLHEGLDLYALDAPGLTVGSPVSAIADGIVTRVDSAFVEMTPGEYEAAMRQTQEQHRTGDVLTDILLGRQVHIEHSPQVVSRYGHLSEIPSSVSLGNPAQMGSVVGNVGVSGTSSGAYGTNDGAHLHFEIWINGRYLGQGLNLYETIRLWQEVFR